jgi:hypothetical protein
MSRRLGVPRHEHSDGYPEESLAVSHGG